MLTIVLDEAVVLDVTKLAVWIRKLRIIIPMQQQMMEVVNIESVVMVHVILVKILVIVKLTVAMIEHAGHIVVMELVILVKNVNVLSTVVQKKNNPLVLIVVMQSVIQVRHLVAVRMIVRGLLPLAHQIRPMPLFDVLSE